MEPVIVVYGASNTDPDGKDYHDGVACGRLLAEAGYAVATGGYGGLMEAASKGAAEAGGLVIGVTAPAAFPGRSAANAFVAEERQAPSLTERIRHMADLGAGFIVLPGSIGTLTELMVTWNVAFVQARHSSARPVVTVGPLWRRLVTLIADEVATDQNLVACVDRVEEAVSEIRRRVAV
jgi:uncharacterized protein (TIGR00730 family)